MPFLFSQVKFFEKLHPLICTQHLHHPTLFPRPATIGCKVDGDLWLCPEKLSKAHCLGSYLSLQKATGDTLNKHLCFHYDFIHMSRAKKGLLITSLPTSWLTCRIRLSPFEPGYILSFFCFSQNRDITFRQMCFPASTLGMELNTIDLASKIVNSSLTNIDRFFLSET